MNYIFQKYRIRDRHRRAFTLIELLVVISIIGLLSSVVFAAVGSARKQGVIGAGQKFDRHTYGAFYDDLVLAWDFDNDTSAFIQDQSGNGNGISSIEIIGGSTILQSTINPFRSGKTLDILGGTRSFSKTGIKKYPTGNFSVSFWIYPSLPPSGGGESRYLYFYTLGTLGTWKFAFQDTQEFVFTYTDSAGAGGKSLANLPVAINSWNQIVLVCELPKLGVYINGKLAKQLSGISACTFPADSLTRVLSVAGSVQYYMDNIRIYSKGLPVSFIEERYLAELNEPRPVADVRGSI